MSDIPTKVFLEILKYVPVEPLFRFRSVCKKWRRIIDDPSFAKHHIHNGIGDPVFFYKHNKKCGNIFLAPIKEFIYSKRNGRIHWFDSTSVKTVVPLASDFSFPWCNGLVLISKNTVSVIWNPFTGECLELAKCDVNFGNGDICSGIGYDEANDDYKVVRIVEMSTYVYSVNSLEWNKVDDFPDSFIGHENGVFAFGALHWIAYSRGKDNGVVGWVVAVDLSTGKYRKIALPLEFSRGSRFGVGLNAFNECLFLSCSNLRGRFVVWVIKDYGSEDVWDKFISLEDKRCFVPIAYLKSKEQVLLRSEEDEDYLWYDVGKKCAERLGIEVNTDGFEDESDCFKYIYDTFSSQVLPASLIRLKRSGDVDDDDGVASQGKAKRKRKSATAIERLPLKCFFGDLDDIDCNDGPSFSDEEMFSDY